MAGFLLSLAGRETRECKHRAGRVRVGTGRERVRCNRPTPHATDRAQSRWLTTDARIILLTKINTPNYPPNQWQLEDMRNAAFKASWHAVPGLDAISGTTGTQLCFHLERLAAAEVGTRAEGRALLR